MDILKMEKTIQTAEGVLDFEKNELYTSPPRKILIVDDEKEIRDLVRETIMIDNFEILEAGTGDRAYEIIQKITPDLIIDRKSTRLNSSHIPLSRMPSSA